MGIFDNFNPLAAAGSALGGLFGLFGQRLQNRQTRENMRLQSKLNQEQMAYSMLLERQQQDWLMNRQYGKTVSGMKNAGLNPATANGTTPSVPSGGVPTSGGTGPSGSPLSFLGLDAIRSYKELSLMDAQKENIEADTDSKRSESDLKEAQAYFQNFMNSKEMRNLTYTVKVAEALNGMKEVGIKDAKIENIAASTNELCQKAHLTQAQTENVLAQTSKVAQEIKQIEAQIGVIKVERGLKIAQTYLTTQQGHSEKQKHESGLYSAQALKEQKLQYKLEQEGFNASEASKILQAQNSLLEFENAVNQEVGVGTAAAIKVISGVSDAIGKALGGLGSLSGFFKVPGGGIHINNILRQ